MNIRHITPRHYTTRALWFLTLLFALAFETAYAQRTWAPGAEPSASTGASIPLDFTFAPLLGSFNETSYDYNLQRTVSGTSRAPGLLLEASFPVLRPDPTTGGLGIDLPLTLAGTAVGFKFLVDGSNIDYWIVHLHVLPTLRYDIRAMSGKGVSLRAGAGVGAAGVLGISGINVRPSFAWRIGVNLMLSQSFGLTSSYLHVDWSDSGDHTYYLDSQITLIALGVLFRLR